MKRGKYTKANFIILLCLVMISAVIGIQISKFNAEPIQGAYNGLVKVFEDEIDAGTLTEEQIVEAIRKGYINDECDIGKFIVQGYLTEYKETLMAEGLLSQVYLDWAEEHYGSGKKTGQTSTTPQPTPEPPAAENNETIEQEQQTEVTQEEPAEEVTEEPEAPHEPVWTETERVPATCTEDGYIRYESDTGEERTDSLPKLEHSYQSEVTQASTCTEHGIKTYTCKNCGDTYTENLPLAAHEWEEEITPESFFKEGVKTTYCKNCGEVSASVTIPSKCPIPLPLFLALIAGVGVVIIVGVVFIVRKQRK